MQLNRPIHKILLIHSGHHHEDGRLVEAKRWVDRFTIINVEKLSLLLVAAYTPSFIKVEKVDDYFSPIPWDTDAEVVGIHAQVMQASRAFEIAEIFRQKNKVVVMGGFLPSMHSELCLTHCDAVFMGDCDQTWACFLEDFQRGTIKKIYKANHTLPLDQIPVPRYDLVTKRGTIVYPVQATRGCPFDCHYCCITEHYGRTYRLRPIDQIIRDIKATKSRQIYFVDDNLMENKKFAKELFRQMIGLGVRWGTQCTINIAEDDELLALAYQAGCRYVAVGVETISQENLREVSKNFNQVSKFKRAFAKVQSHQIAVHALIVFGLPEDRLETFERTQSFLEICGVSIAEFFIMTPYPKTPLGQKVLSDGMIRDLDLSHYRENYVVFEHPHLAPEELIYAYWKTLRSFYSLKSILRRARLVSWSFLFLHLLNNLYYKIKISRGIIPVYFGAGNFIPTKRESYESWKNRYTALKAKTQATRAPNVTPPAKVPPRSPPSPTPHEDLPL